MEDDILYQEEDNHAISPIILIITGVVAVILMIIFLYQVTGENKNVYIDSLDISYIGSGEVWAECHEISVNDYDERIKEYSFDGGRTWQESNIYKVCENGNIAVRVRNKKQEEIGKGSINVTKVDNITPTIIARDVIIKIGDDIDLLEDVNAIDNESGINGHIGYTPKKIDTSKEGTYSVTYKVYDKAGNLATKIRTITVVK